MASPSDSASVYEDAGYGRAVRVLAALGAFATFFFVALLRAVILALEDVPLTVEGLSRWQK